MFFYALHNYVPYKINFKLLFQAFQCTRYLLFPLPDIRNFDKVCRFDHSAEVVEKIDPESLKIFWSRINECILLGLVSTES